MAQTERIEAELKSQFGQRSSAISQDLFINFKKVFMDSHQSDQDMFYSLLAIATALGDEEMSRFAVEVLASLDASPESIQEAKESAALVGMLNTYYKFKGFLSDELRKDYQRSGLRLQSLMVPVTGKVTFEKLAFVVSVVNGCPDCVRSHEHKLKELGVVADDIHQLARLASITKGLVTLRGAS